MGNLIWHEWSRFVSVAASVYLVWAGYWGIFYRKFFWDFVDGTLRDPGGLQPGRSAAPFINIIVKAPIVQIIIILLALTTLTIELPAPFLLGTSIHRSLVLRVVLLLLQAFLGFFVYQATNGALYSVIGAIGYAVAISKGEELQDAIANKGRSGAA